MQTRLFRWSYLTWALLPLLIVGVSCARKQAVSEKPSVIAGEVRRPAGPGPGGLASAKTPERLPSVAPIPPVSVRLPEGPARPGVREVPVTPTPRPSEVVARPVVPVGKLKPLNRIYFDFDKYNLRGDARGTLDKNARWLIANPRVRIQIEGHADERGTDEYNLALGERRAISAREYLRFLGVKSNRITTISYGEFRPADSRSIEAAYSKNRRDEFMIMTR